MLTLIGRLLPRELFCPFLAREVAVEVVPAVPGAYGWVPSPPTNFQAPNAPGSDPRLVSLFVSIQELYGKLQHPLCYVPCGQWGNLPSASCHFSSFRNGDDTGTPPRDGTGRVYIARHGHRLAQVQQGPDFSYSHDPVRFCPSCRGPLCHAVRR